VLAAKNAGSIPQRDLAARRVFSFAIRRAGDDPVNKIRPVFESCRAFANDSNGWAMFNTGVRSRSSHVLGRRAATSSRPSEDGWTGIAESAVGIDRLDAERVRSPAHSPVRDGLLQGGIEIFEYQAALLHAKTMVVDGTWATIRQHEL
jgi:hypothetical protein